MIYEVNSNDAIPFKKIKGDLQFEEGKLTYLSGANGVGKTSLLKFLLKNAEIVFKKKVILIDQMPLSPLDVYTGLDLFKILEEEVPDEVTSSFQNYFESLPLDFKKIMRTPFLSLSGGQKQIVKILLNFYLNGEIYLLDEPTQYLDETYRAFLVELIQKKLKEGKIVFVVDHHPEVFKAELSFHHHLEELENGVSINYV